MGFLTPMGVQAPVWGWGDSRQKKKFTDALPPSSFGHKASSRRDRTHKAGAKHTHPVLHTSGAGGCGRVHHSEVRKRKLRPSEMCPPLFPLGHSRKEAKKKSESLAWEECLCANPSSSSSSLSLYLSLPLSLSLLFSPVLSFSVLLAHFSPSPSFLLSVSPCLSLSLYLFLSLCLSLSLRISLYLSFFPPRTFTLNRSAGDDLPFPRGFRMCGLWPVFRLHQPHMNGMIVGLSIQLALRARAARRQPRIG